MRLTVKRVSKKIHICVVGLFGASSKYMNNCILIPSLTNYCQHLIFLVRLIINTFMFVVKAENIPSSAMTFTLGIHWNAPSSMEICHGFIPPPNDIMHSKKKQADTF